jgi:hypothetical protein
VFVARGAGAMVTRMVTVFEFDAPSFALKVKLSEPL